MSDIGIKVSAIGKDVRRSSTKDLIMTSSRENLKVNSNLELFHFGFFRHTVTIQNNQNYVIKTVEHNLGYVPAVIGHITDPSGAYSFLPYFPAGGDPPPYSWRIWADKTKVVFHWVSSSTATLLGATDTVDIRYYIFSNTHGEV